MLKNDPLNKPKILSHLVVKCKFQTEINFEVFFEVFKKKMLLKVLKIKIFCPKPIETKFFCFFWSEMNSYTIKIILVLGAMEIWQFKHEILKIPAKSPVIFFLIY